MKPEFTQAAEKMKEDGVSFYFSLGSTYIVHLRSGHEYSVQFARLWCYPTSSLCFKVNGHGVVNCACMNIYYSQLKVIRINIVMNQLIVQSADNTQVMY